MGIKKNSRNYGHKKGLETVKKIINEAIKNKIKYLTMFFLQKIGKDQVVKLNTF